MKVRICSFSKRDITKAVNDLEAKQGHKSSEGVGAIHPHADPQHEEAKKEKDDEVFQVKWLFFK
jgi:hypothetical protein